METVSHNQSTTLQYLFEQSKKQVGVRKPFTFFWNDAVTPSTIRHFALGNGEDNPLWTDNDYATAGPYRELVAPPAFFASIHSPTLTGAASTNTLSSLIQDFECRWFQPYYAGDRCYGERQITDVYWGADRHGRDIVFVNSRADYFNQNSEIVVQAETTTARVQRVQGRSLIDREIYHYSQNEVDGIMAEIVAQGQCQKINVNANSWQIGDELPSFVRPPFSLADFFGWHSAVGPYFNAGNLGFLDLHNRGWTNIVTVPQTGWPIDRVLEHSDVNISGKRGMPAPFDLGLMRFAWVSFVVANWIGDYGQLRSLKLSMPQPIIYGDVTRFTGTVRSKATQMDGGLFTLDIQGINQLGEVSTLAQAEVLLPHADRRPFATTGVRQLRQRTMPPFLHNHGRKYATKPAIATTDEITSYADLLRRADQLGSYLQQQSIGANNLVGICADRDTLAAIATLGVLRAGATFVPLDPAFPQTQLAELVTDARLSLILTTSQVANALPECAVATVLLDQMWDTIAAADQVNVVYPRPEDGAYVLYTSGSTGQPKGVKVSYGSLDSYLNALSESELGVEHADVYAHTATFSFSAGIRQLFLPLFQGATVALANATQQRDPIALFAFMREQRVTVWDTIPSIWQVATERLLQLAEQAPTTMIPDSLRLITTTAQR
jgi:acyl dehydratase